QRDVPVLDVVSVGNRAGPVRRDECPELRVGLMFGQQLFGCALCRGVFHGPLPFFAIRRAFGPTVKAVGIYPAYGRIASGVSGWACGWALAKAGSAIAVSKMRF